MPAFLTNWRRRRILNKHRIDKKVWELVLGEVRSASHLSAEDRRRLCDITSLFLYEKSIEPSLGFRISEAMRVRIGCEASIPILNLDLDYYHAFHSVIVYPDRYIARDTYQDEAGVLHSEPAVRAGEAWSHGPVIISWVDLVEGLPGNNVILHEMAHKLDMLDGTANGRPPLHRNMDQRQWASAFSNAYALHTAQVKSGEETMIDPYATTDPAEFFAVCSEVFFETPRVLRQIWPGVYRQLGLYYRQWPASPVRDHHF